MKENSQQPPCNNLHQSWCTETLLVCVKCFIQNTCPCWVQWFLELFLTTLKSVQIASLKRKIPQTNYPSLPSSLFLHLELIDGTPTLKINHGSGTVVLQLPGNVNVADRRWHRLDVRSNSKVGLFICLIPATIDLPNELQALSRWVVYLQMLHSSIFTAQAFL